MNSEGSGQGRMLQASFTNAPSINSVPVATIEDPSRPEQANTAQLGGGYGNSPINNPNVNQSTLGEGNTLGGQPNTSPPPNN